MEGGLGEGVKDGMRVHKGGEGRRAEESGRGGEGMAGGGGRAVEGKRRRKEAGSIIAVCIMMEPVSRSPCGGGVVRHHES